MIRTATIADLPRLIELFARANDTPYDLPRVAGEKCFGPGLTGQPVTRVWGDFEGAAVTCGRYLRLLAVDRERRRSGIGSALLHDAVALGTAVVGAEPGNYFTPGAPLETSAFFRALGFRESDSTENMDADLAGITAAGRRATAGDRERVLEFAERNFSAAWRFECESAFANTPPTVFIAEEAGAIAGFAAHEANNRGLGFFGPTGVAESLRGRGIGRQLLLASLADLRRLGYHRAVIPWTDAIEFYQKSCGAVRAGRFVMLKR
ncbi:MAG: GNAT family N-acetyltransferase [Acidobacteriota bacterium]